MRGSIRVTITILIILVFAVLISALIQPKDAADTISSFEECVAAENATIESNPRTCRSPDGEEFVARTDEAQTESTVSFSGVVAGVDASQAVVDGPVIIQIRNTDAGTTTVAVPTMSLSTCDAFENIADVPSIELKESIIVRGTKQSDGDIVPCDSPDHYLKVVRPIGKTATTTLAVGEKTQYSHFSIELQDIVQENRCSTGAECKAGGGVRTAVRMQSGTSTQRMNIASDNVPARNIFDEYQIGITDIQPSLQSRQNIQLDEYRITFAIESL